MLQAANIDIFNPLVPKSHNSECQKFRGGHLRYFLKFKK